MYTPTSLGAQKNLIKQCKMERNTSQKIVILEAFWLRKYTNSNTL
jgi:hypothetical protein